MKRLFLFMATLLFVVGCSNEENLAPNATPRKFTAAFEDATTRTYVDENFKLLWNADDRLSIFTSTLNEQYKFEGSTGDNSGSFTKIASGDFVTGNTISTNYAVYPYSATTSLSNDEVISLTLPATQSYAENSFGLGANTMVAVTSSADDTFLPFKNLGGYLRLQLYGEGVTVKSISLQGNNSEPLAGEATVTADYGSLPELTLAENGTTTITLDCGEGVTLGASADKATTFWLVVPPTTFEGGFAITITDNEGKTMKKSTTNNFSIERNVFKTMNAFEVITTTPTITAAKNEIIYTSTDEAVVTPFATDVFGANITSNVYENGVGVITFDGPITQIGPRAFRNCTTLETIILSNGEAVITRSETTTEGITTIGASAFSGCTSLTSVIIPEGVTTIGNSSFSGCTSLASIDIPEGVTTIGENAFKDCSSLSAIPTSSGITTIANGAFFGCTSITEYTIPEGVTTIGDCAFQDCTALANIKLPNTLKSIGHSAFRNCKALASIDIPEGITTIGTNTFIECYGLTDINLPNSLTTIGQGAFHGCIALKSIDIPANVTTIESGAFAWCEVLESITIPNSVTSMGAYIFEWCTSLTTVYCQSTTPPTIGINIFSNTSSDIKIYVPAESVDTYKSATNWSTYADCIVAMTNPNAVIYYTSSNGAIVTPYASDVFGANIVSNTYENGVGKITFDGDVTSIGNYAFDNCQSLASIDIPESVTSIGESAFYSCTALSSITIPEGVTSIGKTAFSTCRSLTSINIPKGVTTIENYAFYSCSSLRNIDIPKGVTSIGKSAFSACLFTSITIPNSVISIDSSAFAWCNLLTTVYCQSITPPTIGTNAFRNNTTPTIYVPTASVDTYKSATNWSTYADYITGYDF